MGIAYLKLILRTVIFVTTLICIPYLVMCFYNKIEMLVPVEVLEYFLNFMRRYDLKNHLESLWIEILFKNSKSVLVGCYYRPSDCPNNR